MLGGVLYSKRISLIHDTIQIQHSNTGAYLTKTLQVVIKKGQSKEVIVYFKIQNPSRIWDLFYASKMINFWYN